MDLNQHLYAPPRFTSGDGKWYDAFDAALSRSSAPTAWDPTGLLSMVSFGYVCGNRTLVQQITRTPWIGGVDAQGQVDLATIPPHGRRWESHGQIAAELGKCLLDEARSVCRSRGEIYLLLSGGLDSRIVAGTLARLHREGELSCTPVAVTWGMDDSRDVVYGRRIAEILGFPWQHLPLGPEHLLENIEVVATRLGGMVSPVHLHRMAWFDSVSPDALVLAASYGDSVGRGEFSGSTVLELRKLVPADPSRLMPSDLISSAVKGLVADLRSLAERSPGQPPYVNREHEQQGNYMRSVIGHAMGVIGHHCTLYQMFTHPKVYSYMWSIHPSLRTDHVYAALLESLDPSLARLPWARTNRALKGATLGARGRIREKYHDYKAWTQGPLYDAIHECVRPEWFAERGIFRREAVQKLGDDIRRNSVEVRLQGKRPIDLWVWMAALRWFVEHVERSGRTFSVEPPDSQAAVAMQEPLVRHRESTIRRITRRSPLLLRWFRRARRLLLQRQAVRKYPPRYPNGR